jgi:hypothetical protein
MTTGGYVLTDGETIPTCPDDHVPGCPGPFGGDHEYVVLPMNAMRCSDCGHRLDDMGGCDSCAADIEAAMTERMWGDDDD